MPDRDKKAADGKVRLLVSEVEIDAAVRRIADEIDLYAEGIFKGTSGKKLFLLGILKGSVVFLGDLIKRIKSPIEVDFMKVTPKGESTGLDIVLGLTEEDITGKNIVIIEDIIDSGRTVSRLVDYLKKCGADSVKTCTLLDKPSLRVVEFTPDFVGFEIPDQYVVGYGLDFEGQYRGLPFIGFFA